MQEGWTDEEGSTYFCSENEFRKDMDARYGRENWGRNHQEKKSGCLNIEQTPLPPGVQNLPSTRIGKRKDNKGDC